MGWYPCHCDEDVEPAECTKCDTDTTPYQISVSIPALDDSSCNDCASFAGTYVLTQDGFFVCTWSGVFTNPTTCSPTYLVYLSVDISDDPDLLTTGRVISVTMTISTEGSTFEVAKWRNFYEDDYTAIDCDFAAFAVAAWTNGLCNVTTNSISVTLTAV